MTETVPAREGPRPLRAFFLSLAGSSVLLALLLLSDRRVLELKRGRAEVRQLDQQIAERRRENEELKAAVEAAAHHDFPAEKVAREELHLVRPDDIVLSYPPGSLSGGKTPTPAANAPAPRPTPRSSARPEGSREPEGKEERSHDDDSPKPLWGFRRRWSGLARRTEMGRLSGRRQDNSREHREVITRRLRVRVSSEQIEPLSRLEDEIETIHGCQYGDPGNRDRSIVAILDLDPQGLASWRGNRNRELPDGITGAFFPASGAERSPSSHASVVPLLFHDR